MCGHGVRFAGTGIDGHVAGITIQGKRKKEKGNKDGSNVRRANGNFGCIIFDFPRVFRLLLLSFFLFPFSSLGVLGIKWYKSKPAGNNSRNYSEKH
ncbi:MAG: hypothetical protein K1Y36_01595 [Blastocatellia bacterium]|nr:hypothetical protein [Blastocatellia bacterium]